MSDEIQDGAHEADLEPSEQETEAVSGGKALFRRDTKSEHLAARGLRRDMKMDNKMNEDLDRG